MLIVIAAAAVAATTVLLPALMFMSRWQRHQPSTCVLGSQKT
jgi:hypothetical protein